MTRWNMIDQPDSEHSAAQSMDQPPRPPEMSLRPREPGCVVPLTPTQLRLWNSCATGPAAWSARICAAALRLHGELRIECLRSSLHSLLLRHETLRARFAVQNGKPCQQFVSVDGQVLDIVDLSQCTRDEQTAELERHTGAFLGEKVDPREGPLFKVMLWRLSRQEHVVIAAIDHLIADSLSIAILDRELWALYALAQGGQEGAPLLPDISLQFADYAVWQQQRYAVWASRHDAYWCAHMAGSRCISAAMLPDVSSAIDATYGSRRISLGRALTAKVREVAQRQQLRVPLIILVCYATIMSAWTRERHLIVPVVSHGRHGHPELKNMVGFFANELYLRVQVERDDSLCELARRVDAEFNAARDCQDPGRIPDLLPECSPELSFNWQSMAVARASAANSNEGGGLKKSPFIMKGAFLPGSFAPFFYDAGADVRLIVHFRADPSMARAIERLGRNLRLVAESFAMEPAVRIGSLLGRLQSF